MKAPKLLLPPVTTVLLVLALVFLAGGPKLAGALVGERTYLPIVANSGSLMPTLANSQTATSTATQSEAYATATATNTATAIHSASATPTPSPTTHPSQTTTHTPTGTQTATQTATATRTATATASPTASATVTFTPSPTATATATPTTIPTDWLGYLNYLRGMASLASLPENSSWSYGCWLHSRYMVKNDVIQHDEDPGNAWYTPEGDAAAENSNLMVSSNVNATDVYALNLWLSGPFHGIGMIDPQLTATGFGSYRESIGTWKMGACLDVLRGLSGAQPPGGTYPVRWPGPGTSTTILSYGGNEAPDPLTSCPGYTAPSGPPIYLQIGSGNLTPSVTASSFKQGSTSLEHCVFDETSYTNPNGTYQSLGRSVLNSRDAIILMPRQPLSPGASYTVSLTVNGVNYTWSFTASSTQESISPSGRDLMLSSIQAR